MKVLSIENLTIQIGKEKRLENASIDVNAGDVVLLTGPNGSGKSTIVKIIAGDVFDYSNLKYKADKMLYYKDEEIYDVLSDEKKHEVLRKTLCYISQEDSFESFSVMDCFAMSLRNYDIDNPYRYMFDFVNKYKIYECFVSDKQGRWNTKCGRILSRIGLKKKTLSESEKMSIQYLAMDIRRMSGGQKKLTNIASNLVRSEFCKLVILDEPLNNLDYSNVRLFSNMLKALCDNYHQLGVIIVTHCRSISCINRVIEIDVARHSLVETGSYVCNSCFGKIDEHGMYV